MKRFLLIAAGTVGGLGAVLSVTPPQLGAADLGLGLDAGTLTTPDATVSTPAVVNNSPAVSTPTKKPTKPQSTKPQSTQATSSAPTPASTPVQTPVQTPATTPAAPVTNSINGTFTGPVVDVSYGNVQVQITVTNGKITDAQALIAPTGKNDKYTRKAMPILKQQTLAAQSTNIQGASGASYTTYGWRKSLQGAMVKAGL
ncbi:FMN-binding [Candidatus Nanopelagicaceae bacterium]